MKTEFVDGRSGVKQVIDIMEACHGLDGIRCPSWRSIGPWPQDDASTVREEVARLPCWPLAEALMAQAAGVWDLTVRRDVPTVWFFRTYRPVTALFLQICQAANLSYERLLAGWFEEADFPVLTVTVGKLAAAPLRLCDNRQPGCFSHSLWSLAKEKTPPHVVCDWTLEGADLAAARRVAGESQISFSFQDR